MAAFLCLWEVLENTDFSRCPSESAVFLVGSEDLEERLKLFQFLGSMYDARCSINHGGSAEASDSDIANLQRSSAQ